MAMLASTNPGTAKRASLARESLSEPLIGDLRGFERTASVNLMLQSPKGGRIPRWAWTVTLNAAIIGAGMALAMPGPTLLALAELFDVSTAEVGGLFSFRAVGYIIGGFAGDVVLSKSPSISFAFGAPLAMSCAGAFALPSITSFAAACGLFVFQGLAMGLLDTVGTLVMMNIWAGSRYQNGFVHGFHFFFGLGSAVAPITVGCILESGFSAMAAWTGVGILLLPGTLGFVCLSFFSQPYTAEEETEGSVNLVVLLTGAFLFLEVGLETTFGAYVDTYAVAWLGVPGVEAAKLTAYFWGAICAGRFTAAMVTSHVNQTRYIACSLVLAVGSIAAFAVNTRDPSGLQADSSAWQLRVALPAGLFGFALAPLFPGALLVSAELLGVEELGGQAASLSVAMAALGEALLPLGVGRLFAVRPTLFCTAEFALILTSALIFLCNAGKLMAKQRDR